MQDMLTHFWWILPIVVILIGYKFVLRLFGLVIIPEDSIGIVSKKFVLVGKNRSMPDGAIIALNGEAGIQADTLAPNTHFGLWPWQYTVKVVKFITVPEGKIGVVEAKDGAALTDGKVLAKKVDCDSFQDARLFLTNGGQRGPQAPIIPPGTYRINTELFSVTMEKALEIGDNMVGVVTTMEGKPLPKGEIAGEEIKDHNMFQDAQTFINNGGYKGRQEQVMLSGRYYINPRFATVETKPMTEVPIANVGVVISFVGKQGTDISGDTFKHGNLVNKGEKGVWAEPLGPGRYAINPYTHKIEIVPTANVVLNWATNKSEAHNLDKNLSTITVRSCDGFKFNLDVSQIIHIPINDAPKVISRFGTMLNLVTQVLEPTIGNYFRNAAQGSDVIAFLNNRQERQNEARISIANAIAEYNVGAVDTLIGDIVPPEELMKTLTDRKIAEQQNVTFETQRLSEVTRKELEQARAQAATQARVVDAERSVQIAEFSARAQVKQAEGNSSAKKINASADAEVLTVTGDAEGKRITAIGQSEANVIKSKTEAVGQENYALIETVKALSNSGFKLVPEVVAGSTGGNGSGLVDVLIGNLIRQTFPQVASLKKIDHTPITMPNGTTILLEDNQPMEIETAFIPTNTPSNRNDDLKPNPKSNRKNDHNK
jgi:uncharacterized membrane protein YqiK